MDNTKRNRIYFPQEVQVSKTAVMLLLYARMTATSYHIRANPSNSKKRKNFVDLGQWMTISWDTVVGDSLLVTNVRSWWSILWKSHQTHKTSIAIKSLTQRCHQHHCRRLDLIVILLLRESALWIPKSIEEFREVNFLELIDPMPIGYGIWTGIERFNLTHFQFNNQIFIPTNNIFAFDNIFHPIVIGIHLKS